MKNNSKSKSTNLKNSAKKTTLPVLPKWTYWFIGIIALFLYLPSINYGFVLDDIAVVEQNAYVQKGFNGIPQILSTFYWHGFTNANVGLFRPISLIMFAIEHAISPDSPSLHHFVNVLFYICSSILLLHVLKRMMPYVNPWFFFFVALFFTVHPLHTEVVANIKSRDEIMSFFFVLVCCYYFYKNDIRSILNIGLASFFFFLALLSKEGAIVFLPLLILLELRNFISLKKFIFSFTPFLLLTIVWFIWHHMVIGKTELTDYTYHDNTLLATASIAEQKATAFGIFFRYELKAFLPYKLSYDYSFPYFKLIGWSSIMSWLGLISLLSGLIGIFYFFKKNFLVSFGLATLIFPLLLTGNILFTIGSTMADRFAYISVLGAAIILLIIIGKLQRTSATIQYTPSKIAIVISPILIIFIYMTTQRNNAWISNQTLFTEDYHNSPESARVQYNYANTLINLSQKDPSRSEFQKAIDIYQKVLILDSAYIESSINLGHLYLLEKSYLKAKETFEKAIEISNKNSDLWGGKGEAQFYLSDKPNAIQSLDKALKYGNTHSGVFILRGTIAFEEKKLKEAERIFNIGLKYHPENENLLLNIGNVYGAMKNYVKAIETFERLRKIEPNNTQAIYCLGLIYKELDQTEKAQKMINLYNQLITSN